MNRASTADHGWLPATDRQPLAQQAHRPTSTVSLKATRASRTRHEIARAAATLFAARGYTATSVRDVAREASTDPALVLRHFGSKEDLFLQTMPLPRSFEGLTEVALDDLGHHLVAALLREVTTGAPGPGSWLNRYQAMMRATDSEAIRTHVNEAIDQMFSVPLSGRLDGPYALLRARLVAAQLGGLFDALQMWTDPQLAHVETTTLTETYAPALQSVIDARRT